MDGNEDSLEQLQRYVEDSREFAAGVGHGAELPWPPEIARKLAESNENLANELSALYLRLRKLDSPEGFAGDIPQMPAELDQFFWQAIEWGHNNAAGFARAADQYPGELPDYS